LFGRHRVEIIHNGLDSNLFKPINKTTAREIWDLPINNGLSILPNVNLVSNIGFGMDVTHTTGDPGSGSLVARDTAFPLRHMPHMMRDSKADQFIQANNFSPHIAKIIFSRAIFRIVCEKSKSIFLYFFRKATAKNNRGEIN
jgi:hypothetical protein